MPQGEHLREETSDEQKRRIFDLTTMLEIGKTLLSTLSLQDVIDIVVLTCSGHFHSSDAMVLLSIEDNAEGAFIFQKEQEKVVLTSSDPLIRHLRERQGVLEAREMQKIPELKNSNELFHKQGIDLIVPLRFKGTINGILCMKQKEKQFGDSYTKDEISYADMIAGFASVAVENARLYEMATLDRKTRLYNHGFFMNRLIEEIERAERYQTDLALMMLDLDHFKKINDTFGHISGDLVLTQVANAIKNHVRVYDIPARFGGEEFTVILPETDSKGCLIVAERLRKAIEALAFDSTRGRINVTVSIGIACFTPGVNMTEDIFLERADLALYQAKEQGRNRVIMCDKRPGGK